MVLLIHGSFKLTEPPTATCHASAEHPHVDCAAPPDKAVLLVHGCALVCAHQVVGTPHLF